MYKYQCYKNPRHSWTSYATLVMLVQPTGVEYEGLNGTITSTIYNTTPPLGCICR
jgi:hypothetical protein